MKKLLFSALCALAFAACSENDSEYHQTYFYPTNVYGNTMYADQTEDSVRVVTMDTWTATAESEGDWLDISPATFVVPSTNVPAIYSQRMLIKAHPNNTGKVREGLIKLNTFTTLGRRVAQCHWLNIVVPEPVYQGGTNVVPDTVYFDMEVSAEARDTLLNFRTYAADAELSDLAAWITADSVAFPLPGRHKPRLSIAANPSSEPRIDILRLTSAGITSLICIKQKGQ